MPSETPMMKTNFSFASGYELDIPSCLGVGALGKFPLSALGLWFAAGPVDAVIVSVNSNVHCMNSVSLYISVISYVHYSFIKTKEQK